MFARLCCCCVRSLSSAAVLVDYYLQTLLRSLVMLRLHMQFVRVTQSTDLDVITKCLTHTHKQQQPPPSVSRPRGIGLIKTETLFVGDAESSDRGVLRLGERHCGGS